MLNQTKVNKTLIVVVILLIGLLLEACGSVSPVASADSPPAVIEALETVVNTKDVEAIVALFAEDGQEVSTWGTFAGSDRLRVSYGTLVRGHTMDIANIQAENGSVLYDCYMLNREGQIVTGAKFKALVEDGKIKSNTYVDSLPFTLK